MLTLTTDIDIMILPTNDEFFEMIIDFCPTHNDKIEMLFTFRRSSKMLFVEQHFDEIVKQIRQFVTKQNSLFDSKLNAQFVVDSFKNFAMMLDDEYSEYEQHVRFIF